MSIYGAFFARIYLDYFAAMLLEKSKPLTGEKHLLHPVGYHLTHSPSGNLHPPPYMLSFFSYVVCVVLFFFLKDFIYLYLDRGKGRGIEKKRNISVWLPLTCNPHWGTACNLSMCPDWESNQQPFGSQAGTQCIEPHQPGLFLFYLCVFFLFSLFCPILHLNPC